MRGVPFELEADAAANATGVASAIERAKAAARSPPRAERVVAEFLVELYVSRTHGVAVAEDAERARRAARE